MTRARVGALAVASLLLSPLAAAHAAARPSTNTMVLRYHFRAGQTFAYHVSMSSVAAETGATSQAFVDAVIRYRIVRVDAAGNATATVAIPQIRGRGTLHGKALTFTLPAATATVNLSANGGAHSRASMGFDTIGTQNVGALPPRAVSLGTQWIAQSSLSMLGVAGIPLPSLHAVVRNTLRGYGTGYGQHLAIITGVGSLQYIADSAIGGRPAHLHLTGHTLALSLFGLTTHRIMQSDATDTMQVFIQTRDAKGHLEARHVHLVENISVQPA